MEIRLENVSLAYRIEPQRLVSALTGINLTLGKGQRIALLGPSGSGKSTLLRVFTGLLPPNTGRVLGISRRGQVGLVIQEAQRSFFTGSVWEEVAFGPSNLGLTAGAVNERVQWALKMVGFPERKSHASPFCLSGGEQQRVALAAVLSMEPAFLLLDEPTTGLDGPGKRLLAELLQNMAAKEDLTFLLATHDLDFAFPLTDRVLLLNQGELIIDTSWSGLVDHAKLLKEIGLSLPTALSVLRNLAAKGAPVRARVNTLGEAVTELRKVRAKEQSQ